MKSLSPRGEKSCNSSSKSTKCLMAGGITMSHSSWGKKIPLTWDMPDESFIVQHSLSYILKIDVPVWCGQCFLHPKTSCTPWQISRIDHYVSACLSLSLPLLHSLPPLLSPSSSLSISLAFLSPSPFPSSPPPSTMLKEQVLRGQWCSLFPKAAFRHVLSQRRKKKNQTRILDKNHLSFKVSKIRG